jgi:hypothetical protein
MADTAHTNTNAVNIMELLQQLDVWLQKASVANTPDGIGWRAIFDEVAAGPRPAYLQRPDRDPRMVLGSELHRLGGIMQELVRDSMGMQITTHAAAGAEIWFVDEHGNRLPPVELTAEENAERDRMRVQYLHQQLTLHGGSSPMDAQANRLMGCCFQDCCFAPAGGVPADGTVTPAPGELGSSKQPDW